MRYPIPVVGHLPSSPLILFVLCLLSMPGSASAAELHVLIDGEPRLGGDPAREVGLGDLVKIGVAIDPHPDLEDLTSAPSFTPPGSGQASESEGYQAAYRDAVLGFQRENRDAAWAYAYLEQLQALRASDHYGLSYAFQEGEGRVHEEVSEGGQGWVALRCLESGPVTLGLVARVPFYSGGVLASAEHSFSVSIACVGEAAGAAAPSFFLGGLIELPRLPIYWYWAEVPDPKTRSLVRSRLGVGEEMHAGSLFSKSEWKADWCLYAWQMTSCSGQGSRFDWQVGQIPGSFDLIHIVSGMETVVQSFQVIAPSGVEYHREPGGGLDEHSVTAVASVEILPLDVAFYQVVLEEGEADPNGQSGVFANGWLTLPLFSTEIDFFETNRSAEKTLHLALGDAQEAVGASSLDYVIPHQYYVHGGFGLHPLSFTTSVKLTVQGPDPGEAPAQSTADLEITLQKGNLKVEF